MTTTSTRLVLLAALLSTAAFAQAPNKVAYQGLLLKNDGTPETGMVSIKFSVFDAATAGTEVWTETQPNVVLTQGYYSTVLGEVTAFPANALDGTERFLEISVGGTALAPRMRVVSVPYAVRANNATNVTGGTVNASSISINGTTVIDGTGALAGNTAYTGANGVTVTGRTIGLRPTCGAGDILRWDATASAWVCFAYVAPSSDGGVVSYSADPDGGLVLTGSNFTTFSMLRTCAAGQVLKWSGTSWACANDTDSDTTYGAAATQGLATSGAGNTLFGLQLCPSGQILKSGGGSWACAVDTDTVYTAAPNRGLLVNGTTLAIDACPSGQVMKSAGSGSWACAVDTDTLFDIIPAAGVRRSGNNFGLDICAPGQVLKAAAGGAWGCQADNNAGGTVTQITAGLGLTGGTILTTGTIGLQTSVPNWTVANSATCAPGTVLRVIDLDGTPTCQSITGGGTVTLITAGAGIITGPDAGITGVGAIAVAPTVQNWTVGQPNCPAGQAVQGITANGTTNCIVVSLDGGGGGGGSVTSVATGQGLTGGPITGSGTISIPNGGVTNTLLQNSTVTLTPGTGISITGSPLALGGTATIGLQTPVSAANGGTGITGPTLANQFLKSTALGAWSTGTIVASDIPSLSTTYVDLASSQTIVGQKTFSANIIGNLTGNATTATNGVVTTGSYNDPAWITGLAGSKISGNITGTAAGFTGNLAGDVTGPQGTTVVAGIRGRPVDSVIVPATNNALMWSGTDWEPTSISLANATTTGTLPIGKGGTGIVTSPAAGQYLRASAAGTWNVSGVLAGDIPNSAGDVTGPHTATVVSGLQGRPVSAAAPASGQLLGWNGSTWLPASVGGTAPVVVTGNNIALTLCSAGQVYKMDAGGTAFTCQADSASVQPNMGLQVDGSGRVGMLTTCANDRVLRYDTGSGTWGCSQITNAMIQGPVSIANGGTGAGTVAGARTNLGAAGSGANSDITSLSGLTTALSVAQGGTGSTTQNFVDLSTAQSISGVKTFNSTITGSVSGSAASFTGSLAGDVTGTQGSNTVARIQGRNVAATAPVNGNVLMWTGGTTWTPTTVDLSSTTGTLPINRGGTGSTTQNFVDLSTNQTVAGIKTFSSSVRAPGYSLTSPVTRYKFIPAGSMSIVSGDDVISNYAGVGFYFASCTTSCSLNLAAELDLPNGATITNNTCWVYDNSAAGDYSGSAYVNYLAKTALTSNAVLSVSLATTGASTTKQEPTIAGSLVINNATTHYSFYASITAPVGATGTTMRFYGCELTYTVSAVE
jgi:hypothetical protein